jgi:arylsulfatase
VAVRWRQFRIDPKEFSSSAGNPAMPGLGGYRMELAGIPALFNIEIDPREEWNTTAFNAWALGFYLRVIGESRQLLAREVSESARGQYDELSQVIQASCADRTGN